MIDKALLARVEKQAWFHKYPRGWPFVLLLLALLGTLVSIVAIERAESERQVLLLDRNATEITASLQRRAAENIAVLRAGATLFAAREVTPELFARVGTGLRADDDHGAAGIGWAPWQATPAGVSTPIVYLEPTSAANRSVIGFDMYSEAVRREAMDTAVRQRQPIASGPVHLMQDSDRAGNPGFLIYMPVFDAPGADARIKGFVYSPFRGAEFFRSAEELVRQRSLDVEVFDAGGTTPQLLLSRVSPGERGPTLDRRILVAGRPWIVRVGIKRPGSLTTLSRATLLFGIVLALLVMTIARLITRRAAEDRAVLEWLSGQAAIRTSLTRELNHRVKNTLANVLSIVALTRRRATDLDDLADSLAGRIRALSATHDLLSQTDWSNAPIREIVTSEMAPSMGGAAQVAVSGPDISLAPNDAMSLGLAIHELATNAAKYGALSVEGGKVLVAWRLLRSDLAEVHWRECGGPPVAEPSKRGFGRDLIEKIVAHELSSQVELEFRPEGVECRLQVPVRKLANFALRGGERISAAQGPI